MSDDRLNPTRHFSVDQIIASLKNWAELEDGKAHDPRGYGSDDRRIFQHRSDLLCTVIDRLTDD